MANIVQLTKIDRFDPIKVFKKITYGVVFKSLGKEINPLDLWIETCEYGFRNTKQKGDLFELLCKEYFLSKGFEVWLLKELPEEIRTKLGLLKADVGIDLIGKDVKGAYHSIQAKFKGRKNNGKNYGGKFVYYPKVSWKEISTFDALSRRTGPYKNHWVITTGNGVRRIGKKQNKDRSVCYKGLLKLNKSDFWLKLANIKGNILNEEEIESKEKVKVNEVEVHEVEDEKKEIKLIDTNNIVSLEGDVKKDKTNLDKKELIRQKRLIYFSQTKN